MHLLHEMSECNILSRSVASRYFSKAETWSALLDAGALFLKPARGASPVDEAKARKTLVAIWQGKDPVFGPGRRALPLKSFRSSKSVWKVFPFETPIDKGRRDAAALRLFWEHRPVKELSELKRLGTPEAFGSLMAAWGRFSADVATGLGVGPVFMFLM